MNAFFNQEVEKAVEALREGKVILYPTDTIWGLGCDASNATAIQKIYNIKLRPEAKSMIILLAKERDILQYVAAPDPAVFDYLEAQTKPTTIIFENAVGLPDSLIAPDGSVAIRLVQDTFCRHLIKRLRKPLVSTSANISGQPAAPHFTSIAPEIKQQADYIVQWRQDDFTQAQPSRIIKWNPHGPPLVIRS